MLVRNLTAKLPQRSNKKFQFRLNDTLDRHSQETNQIKPLKRLPRIQFGKTEFNLRNLLVAMLWDCQSFHWKANLLLRVIIMRSEKSYCRCLRERRMGRKIYVLFMGFQACFHYNFRLFHLLSFCFVFLDLQVGLEVAHPGVANDFNDEGENLYACLASGQLKLNLNLNRCQKVSYILSVGVLRAVLPR